MRCNRDDPIPAPQVGTAPRRRDRPTGGSRRSAGWVEAVRCRGRAFRAWMWSSRQTHRSSGLPVCSIGRGKGVTPSDRRLRTRRRDPRFDRPSVPARASDRSRSGAIFEPAEDGLHAWSAELGFQRDFEGGRFSRRGMRAVKEVPRGVIRFPDITGQRPDLRQGAPPSHSHAGSASPSPPRGGG